MVTPFSFGGPRPSKEKKKRSGKQEKRWAEKVKGKQQPASGALWGAQGDVKEAVTGLLANFMWDNKYTDKQSFSVSLALWQKLREQAYKQSNIPGVQLEFQNTVDYPSLPKTLRLVVLEEEDFLSLKAKAEGQEK